MRYYLYIFLALVCVACGNNTVSEKQDEKDTLSNGKIKTEPAGNLPVNMQEDNSINFSFAPDSSTLTAKGSINSVKDHITGYLPVDRNAELTAQLIPDDEDLNIRFTQIIMPDSSMDGPFGRQLRYTLTQKGLYKIIISPSTMAEGKVKGDFLVRIQVREKH